MPKLRSVCLAALAWASLAAPRAHAEEPTQVQQLGDDIQTGAAVKKASGLLVVPIPMVDPQLGDGVTLAGALFYSPVKGGRPWLTGVGALYTSNGDWAAGVVQQADLMKGKLRLTAFAGYGDFQLDFFGSGAAAGAAGRSIKLDEKGLPVLVNLLYQVHGPLYVGMRYQYLKLQTRIASKPRDGDPILPPFELDTTNSALGPAFEYDTRNSEFTPSKGLYIQGQWMFNAPDFGSNFSYNKVTIAANAYVPLTSKTVLAMRVSVCDSGPGAPFYDLCLFGSQHDLRGYEGGQYRDHSMAAAQVELRQHLFWRIGAVAFGGVGAVAPSFGDLGKAKGLPAGGLGLRFQPTTKIPVNMSVDYAWGNGSQGIYLYLGEAF